METGKKILPVAMVGLMTLAGLIVGAVGGYYYGNSLGEKNGRQALLNEQVAVEAEKLAEISKQANPFSAAKDAANPFKDMYQNPFAQ